MLLTAPALAPLHQPCETFSLHMTWNHIQPRAGRCRAPYSRGSEEETMLYERMTGSS